MPTIKNEHVVWAYGDDAEGRRVVIFGITATGLIAQREAAEAERIANLPPVDRSALCTTNGKTPEEVRASQTSETGMHDGYIVLCDAERAKGFVRPYRDRYKHTTCGGVTTMGRSLSETYARDPLFYDATFCCTCNRHFPVNEFVWTADGSVVGS